MSYQVRAALAAGVLTWMACAPAKAEVYWSSPAIACVPDAGTSRNARYATPYSMAVELSQGKVDPVILNCAVTPNHAAQLPDRMSLTYRDTTGTSAAAFAKAFFVKIDRNTGAVSTIASVSSNVSPSTAVHFWQSGQFAQALNFNANYYFVRLFLDRSATSQTVQAFGVAVENNCSNGTIEAPETCDDGNLAAGDGCSASCQIEMPLLCGNGALDPGEQCDDGNTTDGDGCSSQCLIEP